MCAAVSRRLDQQGRHAGALVPGGQVQRSHDAEGALVHGGQVQRSADAEGALVHGGQVQRSPDAEGALVHGGSVQHSHDAEGALVPGGQVQRSLDAEGAGPDHHALHHPQAKVVLPAQVRGPRAGRRYTGCPCAMVPTQQLASLQGQQPACMQG